MPSTTRLLLVRVPVLSKQQTCTLPAKGIRNGSVQNTSTTNEIVQDTIFLQCNKEYTLFAHLHNLARDSNDEFTANDNSTGSSGGITDVRMRMHSKNSLYLLRFGSSEPENECTVTLISRSVTKTYKSSKCYFNISTVILFELDFHTFL